MKILNNKFLIFFVLIGAIGCFKNIFSLDGLCYMVDKAANKVYLRCYCNCYPQGYTQRGRCVRCQHFVDKSMLYMPSKFRAKKT